MCSDLGCFGVVVTLKVGVANSKVLLANVPLWHKPFVLFQKLQGKIWSVIVEFINNIQPGVVVCSRVSSIWEVEARGFEWLWDCPGYIRNSCLKNKQKMYLALLLVCTVNPRRLIISEVEANNVCRVSSRSARAS